MKVQNPSPVQASTRPSQLAGSEGRADGGQYTLDLGKNLPIRESKDAKAAIFQIGLAHSVPLGLPVMDGPVHLDNQLSRRRVEIRNVRADGILPSGVDSVRALSPQRFPKLRIRGCRFMAHRAGAPLEVLPTPDVTRPRHFGSLSRTLLQS